MVKVSCAVVSEWSNIATKTRFQVVEVENPIQVVLSWLGCHARRRHGSYKVNSLDNSHSMLIKSTIPFINRLRSSTTPTSVIEIIPMGYTDLRMELERDEQWDWDMPKKEEKGVRRSTRNEAENETQLDDNYHFADICKDHDLYQAARNGNLDDFSRILHTLSTAEQVSVLDILRRVTPAGNTFLHVASKRHGNGDIATYIAAKDPSLVLSRNSKGDTALHVAAKSGVESMVAALLLIHQDLLKPDMEDEDNILRAKNAKGNTALHEALIRGRESIALHLIQQDPKAALYPNLEGESSLYMAARAGSVKCVSSLLGLLTDEDHINEQFKSKSPIEAAIKVNNYKDVLEAMFNVNPSLIQQRDEDGRTPLHYAASLGHLEQVRYLLDKYPPGATTRSKRTGSFPIHLASIEGYVDIIHLLLRDCPYPNELLDKQGHNILHVAVKHGRHKAVSYILNNPTLSRLINMKDKQGNTPLHLASIHAYPKIVSDLTWDKRVNNMLVNNKGMTALDAAANHMGNKSQFSERLTWAALKAAGTPRHRKTASRMPPKKISGSKDYSERVNTLLLVSTLVATVTFAAGFTVPGGYNSSGEDLGIATMLRDMEFHIFVFSDTIAMYTSIIVAVTLIWAQLGDLNLTYNVLTVAVPLLGLSLCMMTMAFMAGVFVAVSKLRWLSIAVLVMGITCLSVLIALLGLFCFPLTSTRPILRCLSYYPFCLLILATGNWPKD